MTSETISIGFLLLLQSFWVVTWPVYDKFEFGAKIGWKMAKNGRKRPQMAKNDLNVWKMTFETITIEILPLSRSFWVVTWLVCDNIFYRTQNGQKWPQDDVIGNKNDWNWFILQIWSIFDRSRVAVPLSPSGGSEGAKILILPSWKFFYGGPGRNFFTSKLTLKPYYGAFSGNLNRVILRKMHFCRHPFQPKKAIFGLLRSYFWPKTWKIKCFQFIQSKI